MSEESEAVKAARETAERVAKLGDRPSAADLHATTQRFSGVINALAKDQQLRKWCLEKAVECRVHVGAGEDIIIEATKMYEFLTTDIRAAASEFNKK